MVDLASPDIRRLTVDEVRAMYDSGVLAEDERVELEDGVLVRMTPIGAGHSWSLKWLTERFAVASVDAAWEVAIRDQLNFPGGYRHPDVLVTPLLPYGEQPETALLIIEVADSSRRRTAARRCVTRSSPSTSTGSSTSRLTWSSSVASPVPTATHWSLRHGVARSSRRSRSRVVR